MNTAPAGLGVEKVHVWRGDSHVLKGVSFALAHQQVLHVSGPNGAGKTTLLRVVCGLLRPEQGSVSWNGRPIASVRSEYHRSLAYLSHEPALKGDLTALENLRFTVGLRRRAPVDDLRMSLQRTGVLRCADLPSRVLSAGQRRRVALARVLALHATLWILDEPFSNLDASGTQLVAQMLTDHVAAGGSALVVAHQQLPMGVESSRLELGQ